MDTSAVRRECILQAMNLTTYLHKVPMLRNFGAIPLFPRIPSQQVVWQLHLMCSSHPLLDSRDDYTNAVFVALIPLQNFHISTESAAGRFCKQKLFCVFFPFRYLPCLEHNSGYCLITQAIIRRPLAAGSRVRKYSDLSGVSWWAKWQWDKFSPRTSVFHWQCRSLISSDPFFDQSRTLCNRSKWQRHLVTQ